MTTSDETIQVVVEIRQNEGKIVEIEVRRTPGEMRTQEETGALRSVKDMMMRLATQGETEVLRIVADRMTPETPDEIEVLKIGDESMSAEEMTDAARIVEKIERIAVDEVIREKGQHSTTAVEEVAEEVSNNVDLTSKKKTRATLSGASAM